MNVKPPFQKHLAFTEEQQETTSRTGIPTDIGLKVADKKKHSTSYGESIKTVIGPKRAVSLHGPFEEIDRIVPPAAAVSRPSETDVLLKGVKPPKNLMKRHSLIEDGRVRRNEPRIISRRDESGHPQAINFAKVHEWNAYNERNAVRGVQRHFHRGLDPVWPDITRGSPQSKLEKAKGIVDHILSRATKILYKKDRRGVEIVQYRMHLPGEDVKIGPHIENGGSGVMYDRRGLLHMIDRERSNSVLEAHQDAHSKKMQKRATKKTHGDAT